MFESMKQNPHRWALAVFLIALALIAWLDGRPAIRAWGSAPANLQSAIERVPSQVATQALPVLQGEVRHGLDVADKRLGQGIRDANNRLSEAISAANDRLADGISAANNRLGEVTATAAGIRADLQPAIGNISEASKELPGALRDGRFLLARSARTVGHVEQMTDRIEAAVPRILGVVEATGANVQRATDESAATAQQTRIFMGHLSEATKPLPAWARIGLAVAPPVVQTGFTVGSWLALRGKPR